MIWPLFRNKEEIFVAADKLGTGMYTLQKYTSAGSTVLILTAKTAIIWRTKHDKRTFVEQDRSAGLEK